MKLNKLPHPRLWLDTFQSNTARITHQAPVFTDFMLCTGAANLQGYRGSLLNGEGARWLAAQLGRIWHTNLYWLPRSARHLIPLSRLWSPCILQNTIPVSFWPSCKMWRWYCEDLLASCDGRSPKILQNRRLIRFGHHAYSYCLMNLWHAGHFIPHVRPFWYAIFLPLAESRENGLYLPLTLFQMALTVYWSITGTNCKAITGGRSLSPGVTARVPVQPLVQGHCC